MPHKKSGKSSTKGAASTVVKTSVLTSVNGYSILPVLTPTSTNRDAKHYLYVREHVSKLDEPTETDGRVLFAVNLPIDSTEAHLRALFGSLVPVGQGRIESVKFAGPIDVQRVVSSEDVIEEEVEEPQTGKKRKREAEASTPLAITGFPSSWDRKILPAASTAHITFLEASGLQKVLSALVSEKLHQSPPLWGKNVNPGQPPLGLARYQAHHTLSYPSRALLQATADKAIELFESRENMRAVALKRMRSEPDEDGFVTVTRGSRSAPGRAADEDELKEKTEEKKKKGELQDFYRFQLREKKREKMMELRRKFEEDKVRVREMREKRRFRPY
ncbi:hypothetical protein SAICODRAFT_138040 [Saitoella complicata NRRL Y-17804]|nr:uncharacterized protein SAICODRAFT_138040 [Saitoella complicata NRRL Y-17804]ODQ52179.1 hypothetical protein SAICODRAFT_138040 [Saitoella complicata NRRL Y-17804]